MKLITSNKTMSNVLNDIIIVIKDMNIPYKNNNNVIQIEFDKLYIQYKQGNYNCDFDTYLADIANKIWSVFDKYNMNDDEVRSNIWVETLHCWMIKGDVNGCKST